jgi:hypothetical protein
VNIRRPKTCEFLILIEFDIDTQEILNAAGFTRVAGLDVYVLKLNRWGILSNNNCVMSLKHSLKGCKAFSLPNLNGEAIPENSRGE